MKLATFCIFTAFTDGGKLQATHKSDSEAERHVGREISSGKMLNDIRLTDEQHQIFEAYLAGIEIDVAEGVTEDERGAAVKNKEWTKWTDSDGNYIVPYFFHSSFPGTARLRIKKALKQFAQWTCIRFVETKESDKKYSNRIRVLDTGNGCYSYVGLVESKSVQDLSLDLSECTDEAWEIQHEFMHALGFWHEMQRGDRGKLFV